MSEYTDSKISEALFAELREKLPTVMLRSRQGARIFCRAPDGFSVAIGAKSALEFNYKWNLSPIWKHRGWVRRWKQTDRASLHGNYWRYFTDNVDDLVTMIHANMEAGNGADRTRD